MEFNPKKTSKANRTVRMPIKLIERITAVAVEQGISFNQLVIQCCEFALDHLKNQKN